MFGFVAVSMVLGLYVALALYLFGVMTFQGGYRVGKAVPSAWDDCDFLLVFEKWFQVPLLKGPLEALLKIH